MKPGDIILALDGAQVTDSSDLVAKLFTHQPGDHVQFRILRSGNQMVVPVTLQKLDEKNLPPDKVQTGNQGEESTGENELLGMTFHDQTPDLQGQIPNGALKGPMVTHLDPDGSAAAAGLKQGDIILKVGRTAIFSANQLSILLKKSNLNNGVRVFVWRDGMTLFLFLQID